MRKITNRSLSVLLLVLLVMLGMTVYLMRYIEHGKDWALYFSRSNSGSTGQLLDRNGYVLASFDSEKSLFAEDAYTRTANYHVTGDYWNRTGVGILPRFCADTQSYSFFTGTTHAEDSTLTLNIDARLNDVIYSALGNEHPGAMLVCNYRTGELLGMVSTPSVDPVVLDTLTDLSALPDGTLLNRCISAAYIPGSIFKLVTAAAAIENIPDIDSMSFYCEEESDIAGVPIICVGAHYTQDFTQALANSCNIAFANIAVMLGQDTMVKYVTDYGFLDSHKLDAVSCKVGSYPTQFIGDPELGWSGIGQSTDLICPYSELRFICAIANGGTLIEPKLIRGEEDKTVQLIKTSTAVRLKDLMRNNAVSHYDAENNFPGLDICAKTGTAELGDGTSHSWFVGFLNDEAHPYAFVTLIEQAGFGLVAAGGATNQVLQWAVDNMY